MTTTEALQNFVSAIENYKETGVWPDCSTLRALADCGLEALKKSETTQHAGDCTIYRALINERPVDGICTCGYGWARVTQGDWSQMYSAERDSQGFPLSKQTFPKESRSLSPGETWSLLANQVVGAEVFPWDVMPEDPRAKAVIKRLSDDMAVLRADNARLREALQEAQKDTARLDCLMSLQRNGRMDIVKVPSYMRNQLDYIIRQEARAALANDSEIPKGSPDAIPASEGNIPSLDTPKG